MKKIFWLFALFAVAVSARDFDFTNGKVKNFRAVAAKKAAFVVGKGFVAADGTRLVGSNLGLDAAAIERIEVVTGGEKLKFSKLYFDADGKNFAESKVVRGIQKGDRVIFDFAGKNIFDTMASFHAGEENAQNSLQLFFAETQIYGTINI